MRTPLRLPTRGDDFPYYNRRLLQQYEADGSLILERLAVKRRGCRRTHNQDSPSDRHGRQLSDNFRQMACCGQLKASP